MKKWMSVLVGLSVLIVLGCASPNSAKAHNSLRPVEWVTRSNSAHETSPAHPIQPWMCWIEPSFTLPPLEIDPLSRAGRVVRRRKRRRGRRRKHRRKKRKLSGKPTRENDTTVVEVTISAPGSAAERVPAATTVTIPPTFSSVATTTSSTGCAIVVEAEYSTSTASLTVGSAARSTAISQETTVTQRAAEASREETKVAVSTERIERVDDLPLILHWLQKMKVQPTIDAIWKTHGNWNGSSYGQLAVLFLAYVLHTRLHTLSGMEEWVVHHHTVLTQATGWDIGLKDATDDRLGSLLGALGEDEEHSNAFQRRLGRHLVYAYELPTEVGRYDTTTFSVHHALPSDGDQSDDDTTLVRRGYSKDHRPDLGQFRQGLGTLDPAGVPIFTNTLPGAAADDPLYIPAWREMAQTIGHTDFLYVTDCKGAAVLTRATIAHEHGHYLLPMPMTGDVPDQLYKWVSKPPVEPEPVYLEDVLDDDGNPKEVGEGFVVTREMSAELEDGTRHTWDERWLVTESTAHAQRQQKALRQRLKRAEARFDRMRAKRDESVADFRGRAELVLQQRRVADFIDVTVTETITKKKKYFRPGRPTPDSPFEMVEIRHLHLHVQRDEAAIERAMQLAGWRIYVTNVPAAQMTLQQAVAYYRNQWVVERGFHRWKRGGLPALPLFVRLPERIRGLMLLLMVALQALTLMEFVSRHELAACGETIAGLVPGLPKMKTARPTAGRLLARFTLLHLLVEETETRVTGHVVEALTPLQCRILALLGVPETVYDLTFSRPASKLKLHDST